MILDTPALVSWLEDLAEAAERDGFQVVRWGEAGGLPLLGLVRRSRPDRARIYLSAGIHGDEPAGPLALERLIREGFFSSNPETTWTLCPVLNPRGWAAGKRETPEGIDINRDYRRFLTSEAIAHAAWLRTRPANDLYLSLHEDWETEGFYLYEIDPRERPRFGERIVNRVAQVIPTESREELDDHRTAAPGVIRHPPRPDEMENWPEAIFHTNLHPHLSYTFETPSALPLEARVRAHMLAVKAAVSLFLEEWRPGER